MENYRETKLLQIDTENQNILEILEIMKNKNNNIFFVNEFNNNIIYNVPLGIGICKYNNVYCFFQMNFKVKKNTKFNKKKYNNHSIVKNAVLFITIMVMKMILLKNIATVMKILN